MEKPGISGVSRNENSIIHNIYTKKPFWLQRGFFVYRNRGQKSEITGSSDFRLLASDFRLQTSDFIFFHALINPLVEESCLETG